MTLLEDTVLESRYRIDGLVACGGMGAVYRAFDTNLQIFVAIKENYFQTPQAIEQFKREALILARLRHPSLPRVFQHFTADGQQYLVMEFIEGPNLWESIKRQGGPFPESRALAVVDQVCDAVAYLHRQSPPVIHRDIKPQNIKSMSDGQAVLVDFGVSKEGSAESHTGTGARGVTPGFSPPEQYSGGGSSPASDVYALGATLYALLTGVKPPDSISLAIGKAEYVPPNDLNPSISADVAESIRWAMQPRPADRPPTVEVWQGGLRPALSRAPVAIAARQATPPEPSVPIPASDPPAQSLASKGGTEPLRRPGPGTEALPDSTAAATAQATPPSRLCPSCGTVNRDDHRFCDNCGGPLTHGDTAPLRTPPTIQPIQATCPQCGRPSRTGLRFCEDCGTPIIARGSSPEPPSQRCPACKAPNRAGLRFCEQCGTSLP